MPHDPVLIAASWMFQVYLPCPASTINMHQIFGGSSGQSVDCDSVYPPLTKRLQSEINTGAILHFQNMSKQIR
jgi:hypothetical protein